MPAAPVAVDDGLLCEFNVEENYLADPGAAKFAERAAYYLGELNTSHPFREGNGRTQREFIRELGLKAGHYIDWRGTTPEEMIEASRLSHMTGDAALCSEDHTEVHRPRLLITRWSERRIIG